MRADVNECRQKFMRSPTNNYLPVAALCLAAIFPGVSHAGQSVSLKAYTAQQTSMSLTLTLNDALSTAFAKNPLLAGQKARVGMFEGDMQHSRRLVPANPEMELSGARRSNGSERSTDYGIRLSQEFWTANKGDLSQQVARGQLSSAELELDFLKRAVSARVRAAFFDVLLARESLETAGRTVDLMSRTSDLMRVSVDQGKRTRLELNTAIIGVARAKSQEAAAQRQLEESRLALSEVLGIDPQESIRVKGNISLNFENLPAERQLVELALARRSDLQAVMALVNSAESSLDLAQSQKIPNLKVFGFYNREEGSNIIGGGVSVPLPTLHRFGGEAKRASAELEAAQIRAEQLQLTIKTDVLRARAQYRAARVQLEQMSESILKRSEETLELMQVAFRAGKVGTTDVLAAQDNLISVRTEYISAQSDYIAAVRALEISTGGGIVMAASNSQ